MLSESSLVCTATGFATSIRMGEGIDPQALQELRAKVGVASARWRESGVVDRGEVAVLIELYPALLGSIGLYPEDAAKEIADLAEVLLDEVLSALGDWPGPAGSEPH